MSLLQLLHLCDSLFPIGAFSHSDGLEAATTSGAVATAGDLRDWLHVSAHETFLRYEGPAGLVAWQAFSERDWDRLCNLDEEVHALRPSSTGRSASRSMGTRLLKTWQFLHPHPDLAHLVGVGGVSDPPPTPGGRFTLPVAFGVAAAAEVVDPRAMLEGLLYTRLAATASSAMRLMRIGQYEAHALLASALDEGPAVIDAVIACTDRPSAFSPALDIALMSQQYVHSRLFRS